MVISDDCGTAGDGVTLFPFNGGYYVDAEGNEMAATGVLVPMTATITFFAKVVDGYVFPDGSVSQEFDATFTDVPCGA